MISVTTLRSGIFFEDQSQIFEVLAYEHTKMGRGSGNVKVKVRNLENGALIQKSFMTGAQVQEVLPQKRRAQFLYKDQKDLHFMDVETFEQFGISVKVISDQSRFLKEGMEVGILLWEERVLSIDFAKILDYKVEHTGPVYKGNSVTNVYKPAILENGLEVKVPIFVKAGEIIRVDTRTGNYVERGKS